MYMVRKCKMEPGSRCSHYLDRSIALRLGLGVVFADVSPPVARIRNSGKNDHPPAFKLHVQLEQQEGTIVGEDNLKVYITEFYKKLFGASAPTNISLVEEEFQDITQISSLENEILTTPFTEKEVFEAISQMGSS